MNINKNLIKITNDIISTKNKLNFEYMISILRENNKNFNFLGNKRIHNINNQYTIYQNQNLEYLNNINNNLVQKLNKNKKHLLEINNLKKENNIIDKNKKKN